MNLERDKEPPFWGNDDDDKVVEEIREGKETEATPFKGRLDWDGNWDSSPLPEPVQLY